MTFQGYMRATVFEDKRAKMPGYAQPKDNGIRCLWDGRVAWTREGNLHCPHIQELLYHKLRGMVPDGWTLDGELILNRHIFLFQKCQSAVKKDNHLSSSLKYVIFDGYNKTEPELIFSERLKVLKGLIATPTVIISNLRELNFWYRQWLSEQYEGLIFRTDVPYIFGSAARNLMKKKPVKHAEFIVIGVWEGTGKNAGTPVYRLARPDVPYVKGAPATAKNSFGAVPEGDYDEKREQWAEAQIFNFIGLSYTVKFWDYYESGVPQFPIGVGVRDYE